MANFSKTRVLMKQNQIILIAIGFLLVALMATNPSTAEHKEAVKQKVSTAFENNNTDGNAFQKLGAQLGQTIGMVIIDKMIKRDNYLLFSLTKSKFLDNDEKEKVVGFGILGKVYLANEFSENITEKIIESSNPITGNTTKIENLEVAEKDFPNTMSWDDAKKQCLELGDGWRLPTFEELNFMYQNKDKISGFISDDEVRCCNYWSSNEYDYGGAWFLSFNNGMNVSSSRNVLYYVRAVRTIK
jgi:hypothetical protein